MNFFIWLFFAFGVIAVVVGLIPSVLSLAVVIANVCRTFVRALRDDLEVRQAKMQAKKEARLKKVGAAVETKVEEPIVEEVVAEVETTPIIDTNNEEIVETTEA